MVANEGFAWSPLPGWTVEAGEGSLTVRAGADHGFVLEDLPEPAPEELVRFWSGALVSTALSEPARPALDQLVLLGAVALSPTPAGAALSVAVVFAGAPLAGLSRALVEAVDGVEGVQSAPADQADFVVRVRTTATLAEAAVASGDERRIVPYLFVDVAYHHTVSLGPLVVAGETACLHCLAARVSNRWGDPVPPPRPEAARLAALVGGLVAVELDRVAAGTSELANRTLTLDLDRWQLVDETLLRRPGCPGCDVSEGRSR